MTTHDSARRRPSRVLDRLFLGGCTALYVALVAAVAAAMRLYGG